METIDNANAHFCRATVRKEFFHFDLAIEDYKRYIEVYNMHNEQIDPESWSGIADCLYKKGEF